MCLSLYTATMTTNQHTTLVKTGLSLFRLSPQFVKDDVLVPATEAANKRLKPLSCNSVLAVVTTALQCVKREYPSTINSSQPGVCAVRVCGRGRTQFS